MGLFVILGLLSVGLLIGALSDGGNDDAGGGDGQGEAPSRIGEGTDGDDTITGSGLNDLLFGQAGNDFVTAGNGDDVVAGSGGLDSIRGDSGDDIITGGGGADLVLGGRGADVVLGGVDDDTLNGNDGNDSLYGVSGADLLYGNAGDDVLSGIDVPDEWSVSTTLADAVTAKLAEDHGDDLTDAHVARILQQLSSSGPMVPTAHADSMEGGSGNDTLIGDSGDTMTGGAGNDRFVIDAARADMLFTAEGYEPVFITDYDIGNDTLEGEQIVIHYLNPDDAPTPEVTLRQVSTSVHVNVGDETVAVLTNRVVANIDPANISLVARDAVGPGASGLA